MDCLVALRSCHCGTSPGVHVGALKILSAGPGRPSPWPDTQEFPHLKKRSNFGSIKLVFSHQWCNQNLVQQVCHPRWWLLTLIPLHSVLGMSIHGGTEIDLWIRLITTICFMMLYQMVPCWDGSCHIAAACKNFFSDRFGFSFQGLGLYSIKMLRLIKNPIHEAWGHPLQSTVPLMQCTMMKWTGWWTDKPLLSSTL